MRKQVIVAFIGGKRLYYHGTFEAGEQWTEHLYLAQLFDNVDAARAVWRTIDKTRFPRVFVANYFPDL